MAVLAWLRRLSWWAKFYACLYLGTILVDLTVPLVLFAFDQGWQLVPFPGVDLGDFHSSAADLVVESWIRVTLNVSLCVLGVWLGTPREPADETSAAVGDSLNGVALEQPLLAGTETMGTATPAALARSATENAAFEQKKRADRRKYAVVAVSFVANTAFAAFTAIKAVSFDFQNEAVEGSCMATAVICCNAEFLLTKWLADALTEEIGHLIKSIHNHRLFFHPYRPCHWCDVCHTRIKGELYRCRLCDFDCCSICFDRKTRKGAEGLLRGDKGVRTEREMTTRAYFVRALKFAKPNAHLILIAVLCLAANSGARLALPNFQGDILDNVFNADDDAFWKNVKLLISFSVVTGFFGAIRSAAISVVGRRIAFQVRNELFKAIIVQDIAYFDGTMTGQLTSRLTNDVGGMVAP